MQSTLQAVKEWSREEQAADCECQASRESGKGVSVHHGLLSKCVRNSGVGETVVVGKARSALRRSYPPGRNARSKHLGQRTLCRRTNPLHPQHVLVPVESRKRDAKERCPERC
jgi:hypothetical protein